jgi:hypothetical protein
VGSDLNRVGAVWSADGRQYDIGIKVWLIRLLEFLECESAQATIAFEGDETTFVHVKVLAGVVMH